MLRGNKDKLYSELYVIIRDCIKRAYEGDHTVLWDSKSAIKLSAQVVQLSTDITKKLTDGVVEEEIEGVKGKLAQKDLQEASNLARGWFEGMAGGKDRAKDFERSFDFEIKKALNKLAPEEKPKRKYTKRKKE